MASSPTPVTEAARRPFSRPTGSGRHLARQQNIKGRSDLVMPPDFLAHDVAGADGDEPHRKIGIGKALEDLAQGALAADRHDDLHVGRKRLAPATASPRAVLGGAPPAAMTLEAVRHGPPTAAPRPRPAIESAMTSARLKDRSPATRSVRGRPPVHDVCPVMSATSRTGQVGVGLSAER